MSGVPPGHLALGWAWLPPAVESLLALTDDTPSPDVILRDPLAIAHILRYSRPTPNPSQAVFTTGTLAQPVLTDTAATLLEAKLDSPKDTRVPDVVRSVLDRAVSLSIALAKTQELSPDVAAAVTRLAGIGWSAITASDSTAAQKCLDDLSHAANPESTQRRHWGLDAATISRRLLTRWRLPTWASTTVGFLKLSPDDTETLGAPRALFQVVQAALFVAESRIACVGLAPRDAVIRANPLVELAEELAKDIPNTPVLPVAVPMSRDVLIRLLRLTARSRRATGTTWIAESETTIDTLSTALGWIRSEFEMRLRDAKLESLAEFAAGASHEINNPLAVISGQAQLLLTREADPERQNQLRSIVRQTKRVHDLLQGTMHFARPPQPKISTTSVRAILDDVEKAYRPEAEAKGVQWHSTLVPLSAELHGDATQIRQALGHLVRNAIEAAPNEGWVRLAVDFDDEFLTFVIEDSGAGPNPADVPHLFDPFFSGRSAGRGRGLGLPIAWRLARLNGGNVRFDPLTHGPTRFVLTLPQAVPSDTSITEARQTA